MNRLFSAALEVQAFCEQRQWHFCFIGGLAVQRWGQPRATDDVDLTLVTGFGREESFIAEWFGHFRTRPPCDLAFSLRNRVLLLLSSQGVPLDVALGGSDFEKRSVERSSLWRAGGQAQLRTCSAEDLLVHKCFASREQDWVDADGILARQHGKLNLDLVRTELKPLAGLKEEPEIVDRLERRIAHHERSFTRIKLPPPGSP